MYIIFVSSLNANVRLAYKIEQHLKSQELDSQIINLVELSLPLYDTQKEEVDGIPQGIVAISALMEKADGYIFVAPEYNYSLPPVLSNFVAWLSRSNKDFRSMFSRKFIQIATHSGSGGVDVLNAMRIQFTKLGAFVMPREIINTYSQEFDLHSDIKTLNEFIAFTHKG